jgi:hypothetical protein
MHSARHRVDNLNELLDRVETAGLWAFFHKDWLLEIRTALRPQLPGDYHLFVESESILISPEGESPPVPILPDLSVARTDTPRSTPSTSVQTEPTAAVIEYVEEIEVDSKYSLLIRRAPENRIVAALEIVSPTNKGASNRFDREKFLLKRDGYFEAGVNYLEIDALRNGPRVLPLALAGLAAFERNGWTAFHLRGQRRVRGCGWNRTDPPPVVPWMIEENLSLAVDFATTLQSASAFNRWPQLV